MTEAPFRQREKLLEKQKYFQSIQKYTHLKGPYDKITSVVIPLALAPFSASLIPVMSSILNSQGVVLATAMAVSGTVILLAIRLQKSFPTAQFPINSIPQSPSPVLRSCISLDRKKREKKKKKVHFAKDVVDPSGNSEEYRRLHCNKSHHRSCKITSSSSSSPVSSDSSTLKGTDSEKAHGGMPANRVALYNGILRDRVLHRVAYSY